MKTLCCILIEFQFHAGEKRINRYKKKKNVRTIFFIYFFVTKLKFQMHKYFTKLQEKTMLQMTTSTLTGRWVENQWMKLI